jgi:hypothetical protein
LILESRSRSAACPLIRLDLLLLRALLLQPDAVRELYERHKRSPAQMRFYAPLLVNFLVNGHGEARSSGELEVFVLGKCES